jgi:acid phosphatase family membrane protein YuiD
MQHFYARVCGHVSLVALVAVGFCGQAAAQTVDQDVQDVSPTTTPAAPAPSPDSSRASSKLFVSHPKPSSIVSDLFAPLATDFRQFGSTRNMLLIGIGGAASFAAHPEDARIAAATWPSGAAPVMKPGEIVGSFAVQTGAALATYTVGRLNGSSEVARIGAELFRAQMVSQGTAQALKVMMHRTRPDGTSLSFPSGHSASMFAAATVLQSELGWKVGVPAYAAAAWVAASRVEMKRHYMSDVIAGATVGILAGHAVTFGHGNTRFALSPTVVPGGMGVSITKLPGR